jgi:murein peptide amidase A
VLAALAAASATLAAAPALPPRFEAGRSVDGRRIVAVRRGRADAPMRLLVTGSTHGTESAGHAIVARLRKMTPPDGVQVWTVRTFNPDGAARGTRQNARGVDLNRNFPYRWRAGGGRGDA